MPAMRGADRGDSPSVARGAEPVVDRGADPPALDWRVPGAGVAGDQQDYTLMVKDGPLKRAVDRCPRLVEPVAVEVEDPVRLDRS
jgi:hypothetical protein